MEDKDLQELIVKSRIQAIKDYNFKNSDYYELASIGAISCADLYYKALYDNSRSAVLNYLTQDNEFLQNVSEHQKPVLIENQALALAAEILTIDSGREVISEELEARLFFINRTISDYNKMLLEKKV